MPTPSTARLEPAKVAVPVDGQDCRAVRGADDLHTFVFRYIHA